MNSPDVPIPPRGLPFLNKTIYAMAFVPRCSSVTDNLGAKHMQLQNSILVKLKKVAAPSAHTTLVPGNKASLFRPDSQTCCVSQAAEPYKKEGDKTVCTSGSRAPVDCAVRGILQLQYASASRLVHKATISTALCLVCKGDASPICASVSFACLGVPGRT